MTLTWKEFLNLAAVVQNLDEVIGSFDIKRNEIIDFNRQVFQAAQNYFDFLQDERYMEFIIYMRISYILSKIYYRN